MIFAGLDAVVFDVLHFAVQSTGFTGKDQVYPVDPAHSVTSCSGLIRHSIPQAMAPGLTRWIARSNRHVYTSSQGCATLAFPPLTLSAKPRGWWPAATACGGLFYHSEGEMSPAHDWKW